MSLTSQTRYHKGHETLLCVPWVNVWHVSKDKINDVSVNNPCGKTHYIISSTVFTGCRYFSINHCTARQLPFTARIMTGELFSALHDSMLGTWVKIRAMISGLLPNAAGCYEFHPPLFIRHRSAPLFIKPLNSWTLPFTAAFFCSVLTFASLVSTENRGEMMPNIIIWT